MILPALQSLGSVRAPRDSAYVRFLAMRVKVFAQSVWSFEFLVAEGAFMRLALHVAKPDVVQKPRWAVAC